MALEDSGEFVVIVEPRRAFVAVLMYSEEESQLEQKNS